MRQGYYYSMNAESKNKMLTQLKKLGLSTDLGRVYIELWEKGSQTVVQLSRQLDMGRNKIYRILDDLKDLNLVNQTKTNTGSEYNALDYSNLQLIVERKKEEYKKARKGLDELTENIKHLHSANAVSSNVIHYNGLDGLKQVNWNLVHTQGTYRVYEVSRLSQYLDENFAEKLRMEWLRRKIHSRDITNDKEIEGHTNITEFTKEFSEYRYIDPNILKIETEMYIYNNVVTILKYDTMKYDPSSIFCVEIYNEALASMQKQIYDVLWKKAQKLEIVNDRGKRELIKE